MTNVVIHINDAGSTCCGDRLDDTDAIHHSWLVSEEFRKEAFKSWGEESVPTCEMCLLIYYGS